MSSPMNKVAAEIVSAKRNVKPNIGFTSRLVFGEEDSRAPDADDLRNWQTIADYMTAVHPQQLRTAKIMTGPVSASELVKQMNRHAGEDSWPELLADTRNYQAMMLSGVPKSQMAQYGPAYFPLANSVVQNVRSPGALIHELGHGVDMQRRGYENNFARWLRWQIKPLLLEEYDAWRKGRRAYQSGFAASPEIDDKAAIEQYKKNMLSYNSRKYPAFGTYIGGATGTLAGALGGGALGYHLGGRSGAGVQLGALLGALTGGATGILGGALGGRAWASLRAKANERKAQRQLSYYKGKPDNAAIRAVLEQLRADRAKKQPAKSREKTSAENIFMQPRSSMPAHNMRAPSEFPMAPRAFGAPSQYMPYSGAVSMPTMAPWAQSAATNIFTDAMASGNKPTTPPAPAGGLKPTTPPAPAGGLKPTTPPAAAASTPTDSSWLGTAADAGRFLWDYGQWYLFGGAANTAASRVGQFLGNAVSRANPTYANWVGQMLNKTSPTVWNNAVKPLLSKLPGSVGARFASKAVPAAAGTLLGGALGTAGATAGGIGGLDAIDYIGMLPQALGGRGMFSGLGSVNKQVIYDQLGDNLSNADVQGVMDPNNSGISWNNVEQLGIDPVVQFGFRPFTAAAAGREMAAQTQQIADNAMARESRTNAANRAAEQGDPTGWARIRDARRWTPQQTDNFFAMEPTMTVAGGGKYQRSADGSWLNKDTGLSYADEREAYNTQLRHAEELNQRGNLMLSNNGGQSYYSVRLRDASPADLQQAGMTEAERQQRLAQLYERGL